MTLAEIVIWSAASGALALVMLLSLADAVYSRSQAGVQSLVYLSTAWLLFTLLSGLPEALLGAGNAAWVTAAEVLIGPLCAGLAAYGASHWLSAPKRDRVTALSFRTTTLLCLVGGPLCLLLPRGLQLPASAALAIVTLCVTLWLAVRATQQGDRLAWGLATGCLLTLPLQCGLYWLTLNTSRPSLLIQAAVALLGLLSGVVIAGTLWLRKHQALRMRHPGRSRRDPVTRLYSSVVMVQKIIRAQRRMARTRRDGALMAVQIFEPERLLTQVGHQGLNDIYSELARRMQRHTGVVNPAGRYYDRCFIVLIETLHSPRWIRTLGLRVAASLRKPLEVSALNGERIRVNADIGVGLVHLAGNAKDVDELLHDVQDMATAARALRSRAALLDDISRQAVPVEHAELGASWHAMRSARAHPPRGLRPAPPRRSPR